MSAVEFVKSELSSAVLRGVRQCVVISSRSPFWDAVEGSAERLQVFALDEGQPPDSPATLIATEFQSEPLPAALQRSEFDNLKTTLFVWLGSAKYRSLDAVLTSLAFIASLPKGSGVLLDYATERSSLGSLAETALDAMASRISEVGGTIKHLIQPQAVNAMLRGFGFQSIVDVAQKRPFNNAHLVSALL